jgi:hypothetical protein
MNAWIKIDHNLERKPEVMRLAATMGVSTLEVVGLLVRFWCWIDEQSADGSVPLVSPHDVDTVVRKDGFCAAMLSVGWVHEGDKEGINVPNFDRHNSDSAKKRATEAKKKQRQRARNADSEPAAGVPRVSRSCPAGVPLGAGLEKRREEKNNPPNPPAGGTGRGTKNGRGQTEPLTPVVRMLTHLGVSPAKAIRLDASGVTPAQVLAAHSEVRGANANSPPAMLAKRLETANGSTHRLDPKAACEALRDLRPALIGIRLDGAEIPLDTLKHNGAGIYARPKTSPDQKPDIPTERINDLELV